MFDIRFWREGEQTAFEVIKGDHKLVARRDIGTEGVELKANSAFIQTDRSPAEVQQKSKSTKNSDQKARS